jgi:hypothetical protein
MSFEFHWLPIEPSNDDSHKVDLRCQGQRLPSLCRMRISADEDMRQSRQVYSAVTFAAWHQAVDKNLGTSMNNSATPVARPQFLTNIPISKFASPFTE